MTRKLFLTVSAAVLSMTIGAHAQEAGAGVQASSESRSSATVSTDGGSVYQENAIEGRTSARARLIEGELGPRSQPNDEVILRLDEDAKAEDGTLIERGSRVRGIVQSVQRVEVEQEDGQTVERSVVHVLWNASGQTESDASPGSVRPISTTVQALTYVHPFARSDSSSASAFDVGRPRVVSSGGGTTSSGGGLLGGAASSVGGTLGGTVQTTTGIAGGAGAGLGLGTLGTLDSMVLEAPATLDATTTGSILAAIEASDRSAESSNLFQLGQGAVVSPQGDVQQVDLFTRSYQDSVITLDPDGTAIRSGAEALMLFGVE